MIAYIADRIETIRNFCVFTSILCMFAIPTAFVNRDESKHIPVILKYALVIFVLAVLIVVFAPSQEYLKSLIDL